MEEQTRRRDTTVVNEAWADPDSSRGRAAGEEMPPPGTPPAAEGDAGPAGAGGGGSGEDLAEFYIPASTSYTARRPRTLKHGDTFGVFDHYGDVPGTEEGPEGLFHEDTRHVSVLRCTLHGRRPLLLGSTVRSDNSMLTADLTNADIYREGQLWLPRDTLHIKRSKVVVDGACHERFGIRNFDLIPRPVVLRIEVDADFADIFEVRGHPRPERGTRRLFRRPPDALRYHYRGRDGVRRYVAAEAWPAPTRLERRAFVFECTLPPGGRTAFYLSLQCRREQEDAHGARRFFTAVRTLARERRRAARASAGIASSHEVFNEVLARSFADLRMLTTQTPWGPFPYAGVPWFSTPFGRDALITSSLVLWAQPSLALGVLRFLAHHQARRHEPEVDAEPGKILHEMRRGELANLGVVPFGRYYGSVDATPLFVVLARDYHRRTGDRDTLRALWPAVRRALEWIRRWGDRDGDGFVEYGARTGRGLANQGWKDSGDSISHRDGSLATGPIALAEVQGYAYAALRAGSELASEMGDPILGTRLRIDADALARRFDEAFWSEALGTYALALDGEKRPCEVKASNAGHLLWSGIVPEARAERVAEHLLGWELFCGWGIRTLAEGERRFNPMSYHNGSVWPHDNAIAALGLARYGYRQQAERILSGLFAASEHMDLGRLPELFCGFRRRPGLGPTLYPVACAPQAWAAAAPLGILAACLGLEIDASAPCIRFTQPVLPRFLDALTITNLRVGDATADIELRRRNDGVSLHVVRRTGALPVEVRH